MEHLMVPHKMPKAASRSHPGSPAKVRSKAVSPSRDSKRRKSPSDKHKEASSRLPKLSVPAAGRPPLGSSFSWDSAEGQAFMDRVTARSQLAPSMSTMDDVQAKDNPYLALVQLFNQFQGMPIDTKKVLVTVTVLGSTGPLRMLLSADATVTDVIKMALWKYAHEGRVPALGHDERDFHLYSSQFSSQALKHDDRLSDLGTRNFVLIPIKQMHNRSSSSSSSSRSKSSSCASESQSKTSSSSSPRSWWSYVTGIKSLT